jgi:hypothetical protein
MKEYIGEIIGGAAVIIAALIGLLAKKSKNNKQVAKKMRNSSVNQANGSITIEEKYGVEESRDFRGTESVG